MHHREGDRLRVFTRRAALLGAGQLGLGYACGAFFGCGFPGGLLDHPAGSRVPVSTKNQLCDDPNN
jgi:hypothetical protein